MAVTKLVIEDVDETFAKLLKQLHAVYSKRIKCGVHVSFSGAINDVKFKYHDIDAITLLELTQKTNQKELCHG